MIKLLIGGSPCTHWSIAQKNNRETEPEGLGWELFKNYLIAKEKFKPDFFLYENNKSAAQAIKDQISRELGVDLMYINSALVSAQNRQRFYAFNWEVEQPEDRGILLKDILETGEDLTTNEKSYCLTASYAGACPWNTIERGQRTMIAEPVPLNTTADGKAQCVRATCYKDGIRNLVGNDVDKRTCVAEPVEYKVREGSEIQVTDNNIHGLRKNGATETESFVYFPNGKTNALLTGHKPMCIEPMRVSEATTQGYVDIDAGDCVDLTFPNSKTRRGRSMKDKCNCLTKQSAYYQYCGTIDKPIYEVKDGFITIKDKQYPIKLKDGYYIIRKLTPIECERLQTLPDNYTAAVSNAQRYKGLGNGWTAEVIIHIINGVLKDVPKDEEIIVLSMYDGIGTGRYCLDKMGFTNVKYYAYEIDKYAKQVSMSNYPDIIQCGDAFDLRNPDWTIGY